MKILVISNYGNREPVIDKECGFVVPKQEPKAMAEAFLYIYRNKDENKKMGEKAKLQ